jgi:hypothetical protein
MTQPEPHTQCLNCVLAAAASRQLVPASLGFESTGAVTGSAAWHSLQTHRCVLEMWQRHSCAQHLHTYNKASGSICLAASSALLELTQAGCCCCSTANVNS